MKTTANYGLKKPDGTDVVNIDDFNYNADILDTKIKEIDTKASNITVPVTSVNNKTGAVTLAASDVGAVPTSRKVNNKPLSADIALSATDIKTSSGTTVESQLAQIKTDKVNKNDYVANNGFAKTSGTATAYTVALNPAPTAYVDGMTITIVPHINCGVNPTLNINGLGATPLLKTDGTNFQTGELEANKPYSFVRVGSNFFIRSSGIIGGKIPSNKIKFSFDNKWRFNVSGSIVNAVAIDKDDNTYIGTYNYKVKKISQHGSEIWDFSGNTSNVEAVAVGKDGYVYSGAWGTALKKISPAGKEVWSFPTDKRIYDVFVDDNNYIFMACSNYIIKVSSSGSQEWESYTSGYTQRVLVDKDGFIYITIESGRVKKLNPDGSLVWELNVGNGAHGLALDKNGNVYAGTGISHTVVKLSPTGSKLWTCLTTKVVLALDVDEGGNIYGCGDGGVFKVSPTGQLLFVHFDDRTVYDLVLTKENYVCFGEYSALRCMEENYIIV
ncbi:MAG: PQQ-binding-like beta-propeller repeat protein [Clostridiaceae bacterium]